MLSGVNVNFAEKINEDTFAIRTYERGVEGETLSCGTGATAVAIAMFHSGQTPSKSIALETQGGVLKVRFEPLHLPIQMCGCVGLLNKFLKGIYSGRIRRKLHQSKTLGS